MGIDYDRNSAPPSLDAFPKQKLGREVLMTDISPEKQRKSATTLNYKRKTPKSPSKTKNITSGKRQYFPRRNLKTENEKSNIFIFDWDDTLFFTSHLNRNKDSFFSSYELPKRELKKMKEIEYYVDRILNKALSYGMVFIITNSSDGWIQKSAKLFYPELTPILNRINIISARSLFEKKYPNNLEMWKIKAFTDLPEIFDINKKVPTNIICIGDNDIEIKCGKKLAESFDDYVLKTVKFRENPDLDELIKQLNLIDIEFMRVLNYPKTLSILVDKKNTKTNEINEVSKTSV